MRSNFLTQKQKKVFEYIGKFIDAQKQSPTVTEIAHYMGASSLRTITQYLDVLERKGLISRCGQKRGIRIISTCEFTQQTFTLPVISSAGCDNLSVYADQLFDEYITVDRSFLNGCNPFNMVVVKALGDSMIDGGIETGDLVLTENLFLLAS